jgi:N-acetylmuramoyl-L-alanine amidase
MRIFAGSLLFTLAISAFVYSCAHNPYAKTNKLYKKQAKDLSRNLQPVPN